MSMSKDGFDEAVDTEVAKRWIRAHPRGVGPIPIDGILAYAVDDTKRRERSSWL